MLFDKLTGRDLPALQLLTPRADRHHPGFMTGRRYQSCAQPSAAMVSGSHAGAQQGVADGLGMLRTDVLEEHSKLTLKTLTGQKGPNQ